MMKKCLVVNLTTTHQVTGGKEEDSIMKIAICDDNMQYVNTFEDHLNALGSQKPECDVYFGGEELLTAYQNKTADYDAIFLDMEMGELDGIETANRIREIDVHVLIVFVTSHTKYMQRSFECMPFRFLMKPINQTMLKKVLGEIRIKLQSEPETFIFLENKKRTRVYCSDIIFFESNLHHILIYMKDGSVYKMRKTMAELMETVPQSTFVMVHRAFVINLNHVFQIAEADVIMHHCDQPIPVSRTYRKALQEAFLDFKERKYLL